MREFSIERSDLIVSEDGLQRQIVAGLRLFGFRVYVTTRRPKRCRCGAWPRSGGGDGASRGIGDLIVRHPGWAPGVCMCLEIKKPGPIRWSSAEQKLAAEVGDIIVVQSLEDALQAVRSEPIPEREDRP